MNAGLVGLMNYLIHAGDDKARNKEYDRRREQDIIDRKALMEYQRETGIADRDEERQYRLKVAELGDVVDARQKDEALAKKNQILVANTTDFLNTVKSNPGVLFGSLPIETQIRLTQYFDGNVEKTALAFNSAQKEIPDLTTNKQANDLMSSTAKSMADKVTEENREKVARAVAPYVVKNAVAELANKTATALAGGSPPSDVGKNPHRVALNPDSSFTVHQDPWYETENMKAAKAMSAMKTMKSDSKLHGFAAQLERPPSVASSVDADGNPVVRTPNTFTKPPEPEQTPVRPAAFTAPTRRASSIRDVTPQQGLAVPDPYARAPLQPSTYAPLTDMMQFTPEEIERMNLEVRRRQLFNP